MLRQARSAWCVPRGSSSALWIQQPGHERVLTEPSVYASLPPERSSPEKPGEAPRLRLAT